jgi:hypothetical protein
MGLDASVSCTCYREGRAAPPPVPRELIVVDDDGWLELDLPYDGNEERFAQYDGWCSTACEHEDMSVARVRVSNWSGYRAFQQALGHAGWERFPILRAELPNANYGSTSATASALALDELAGFRERPDLGHDWFLVDGDTGEVLHRYIAAYDGKVLYGGAAGVDIGFDERGLFVITRTQPARELFRAMRVEQRLLDPDRETTVGPGPVEFIDLDSGRRLETTAALSGRQIPWRDKMHNEEGKLRSSYPRHLQVERRTITAADFEFVLQPLEEVFRAAVATGNPVRWT